MPTDTPDRASTRIVKEWLTALIVSYPVTMSSKQADQRIAAYVPMLCPGLPDAAFNKTSHDHVHTLFSGLPPVDELHTALAAWWQAHRPSTLPLDARAASLDAMGQGWISQWQRRSAEGATRAQMTTLLGLVRERDAGAYDWIIDHDLTAASIAAQRSWPTTASRKPRETELAAEWADPEAVVRAVRTCFALMPDGTEPPRSEVVRALGLLRALVGRWAPQNLDAIPFDPPMPVQVRAVPPVPWVPPVAKPSDGNAMPADALAAIRAVNPSVQAATAFALAREEERALQVADQAARAHKPDPQTHKSDSAPVPAPPESHVPATFAWSEAS